MTDSVSFTALFCGAVRWMVVLWRRGVGCWGFFNEEESSSGEREVTLCPGRWVEKAPDWRDLSKGREWSKGYGWLGSC